MKKLVSLSIAGILAIGLSGCFGGKEITTPVTKRQQEISVEALKDVNKNGPIYANKSLSQPKYFDKQVYTLGELKTKNKKLYDLIYPLAQEAQKMFKERNLPKDIQENAPKWLTKDVNQLKIILVKTKSKRFGGRFTPPDILIIINYSDNIDKNLARFLIGHEFGHAIAMHKAEEKTARLAMLHGASNAAEVALDVSLNEAYKKLKDKNPKAAQILDEMAKRAKGTLYTQKDIEEEKKIIAQRKNSFAVQMAMKANQKDKLEKLGVNLEIPIETRVALKKLIKEGMSVTGAIETLKNGIDFTSVNVIALTQHPKKQELEADKISLELNQRLHYNVKEAACKRFAGKKEAGIFDAHPSYADRRANLGCNN